ncbi:MAG: PAS domain S-box protein [Bacteroidetes bacterium]|nr:PAS domain S-box protein [Bacteroidota bacterium]
MTTLTETNIQAFEDNEYYQNIVSQIQDVIISTDENLIIKTWNKAAEKVYEINAAYAIGRKTTELLFQQYVGNEREEVIQILLSEGYWRGIVKAITLSGKVVILQMVYSAIKDKTGKHIGYTGVGRDVTTEAKSKKAVESFASILQLLDESFLIIDSNFKVIFLNLNGSLYKALDSDYQVGDSAFKYVPESYHRELKNYCFRALRGETVNYSIEINAGPKFYLDLTYKPIKDDFNSVKCICIIIKDLTIKKEIEVLQQTKKAIEESYFKSRKFFEEFMENSPMPAWVTDRNGTMHYMNQAYLSSFGFSKVDIGKSIEELYPEELSSEYLEVNKKVLETESIMERIEKVNCDNNCSTIKIIKFPIIFKDEKMIAGWCVDISDQVALQESLFQLNENKNKIMSVIAHDVRGPLGINANFIDAIIDEYESSEKLNILKHLKMLKNGIVKCYNLTEELLLWAKSQMESVKFKPVAIDTNAEILRIIDSVMQLAQEKKIEIEIDLCDAEKIYADRDMFDIALRNFITNALKFSEPGNKIIIASEKTDNKLFIHVRDFGIGIKKALVEKILKKQNNESTYGTKGEKGAGLGLVIAKDYIEKNNGEMFINSDEKSGSVFSFNVGFA